MRDGLSNPVFSRPRNALAIGLLLAWSSGFSGDPTVFGDGFESVVTTCPTAGGSGAVAEPELLATLSDRFHESWLASPVVVDLDGDDEQEIVAARSGVLVAWHLNNDVVFSAPVQGRIWASPVVGDFTADAGLEIAVAARDTIHLFTATGQPAAGFPVVWRDEMRSLAGGDIDGDGDLELVAVTTSRLQANNRRDILYAVHHNGSVVNGFPPNTTGASGCDDRCFVTGGFDQNIALGNVDADPALEVFAGQDNAYLSLHDGDGRAFDANDIFSFPTKFPGVRFLHDYAEAQQGFANNEATANQAHFTNSAPSFSDVDGDGLKELVILGSVQNAAQSDRERGVALWAVNPDGTRPADWLTPYHAPDYLSGLVDFTGTNIVAATNQVTVADFDNRVGEEFVFVGFDGRIHAVNAAGNELWTYTYTMDARVLSAGVAVVDLSADGEPEIVFATYSPDPDKSALFVLSASGQLRHLVALPDRGAMSVPTIADADGDGDLEIVVSLKDAVDRVRQVLVYSVAGSQPNCLLWPTGRANMLRNGDPG